MYSNIICPLLATLDSDTERLFCIVSTFFMLYSCALRIIGPAVLMNKYTFN